MTQETADYPLGGGLDLVTPPIRRDPGRVIASSNYEPDPEGYRRISGYERTDGQQSPSRESYWTLDYDAGMKEPTAGLTVIGATSGATGIVVTFVLESGSWVGGDAAGYLVIRSLSGTFQDDETIQISEPEAFSSGFSSGFF